MKWNITTVADNFKLIQESVPELVYFGSPSLHKGTSPVSLGEARDIVEKLSKTLIRYRTATNLGRGIAAPQIGISKRIFITYVDNVVEAYLNPEITEQSEQKNCYKELCMSSSLMWADVERPREISMSWQDLEGNRQEKSFDGFLARLLQHEYDHLVGCVCLDKAVPGTISFVESSPFDEKLREV